MSDTTRTSTLTEPLAAIKESRLRDIKPGHADQVTRRIVDGETLGRLDVAAFNSAP